MTSQSPHSGRHPAARCVRSLLALVLLAALTACGDRSEPGNSAATTTTTASSQGSTTTSAVKRSAPRWETVTTLAGSGNQTTDPFPIMEGVIQWRARWSCEAGKLRVVSDPVRKAKDPPMIDAACQGLDADKDKAKPGYATVEGNVKLVIEATGPWQITVDQQIDVPLLEPPLPGMDTAKVLGRGDFYNVDMKGQGTARLHQLADGTHALRFENFEVSQNTDLFVWLSESPAPKTTKDAVDAPYVVLGNLKSTIGSQNYVLPADLPPERIKSVVIWCAPVRIVYTAAVLAPPA